ERSLEEVADGELEQGRLVDTRTAIERESPLEPQRADGREPAETEADGLKHAKGKVILPVLEEIGIGGECVSGVVEDDALDSHLFDDRKLQLEVEDQLLVSAHRKRVNQIERI